MVSIDKKPVFHYNVLMRVTARLDKTVSPYAKGVIDMKAKRFSALLCCTVTVLSLMTGLFTAVGAADIRGDWTVYRTPGSYIPNEDGSEKVVAPCPGYEYTDDGFSILAPSWKDCTPFYTIQTIDKICLQDGFYMQFCVDNYSYAGDNGADHWLAFSIWDSQNLNPGSTKYGQGWIGLMYPLTGDVYSHVSNTTAFASKGKSDIESVKDGEGRELFELEVTYDGADYAISVNGVTVAGLTDVNAHLDSLNKNGDFYVGVTLYTGVRNGAGDLTITKSGTSKDGATVPQGTESLEPEANNLVIADIADPSTVPEGTPAMLWNSELVSKAAGESNMVLSPMGDNAYHCLASESTCEFRWVIPNSMSYDGADFPVFTMLLRNYLNDGGHFFYCAGDELVPSGSARLTWNALTGDGDVVDIGDDEYIIVVIDLTDKWSGRIHQVVPGFSLNDPDYNEWDICYMGFFRTIDEAVNYGYDYLGVDETEAPTEAPTDAPTEEATDAPTEDATEAPTDPVTSTPETEPPKSSGCRAAVGMSAVVLMMAAAAGVALRKRS